jgi:hypothetical protein
MRVIWWISFSEAIWQLEKRFEIVVRTTANKKEKTEPEKAEGVAPQAVHGNRSLT